MMRLLLTGFLLIAVASPKCGDSSSSDSSSAPLMNFQSITVNAGPANNYFNGAFTSVTVCAPGQSTCQTIDGTVSYTHLTLPTN